MDPGKVRTVSAAWVERRPAVWIVASVLVAILVVLVAVGWWLLRPDALEPVADGVRFEVVDDRPRLTSSVVTNRRPIEVMSVRPAGRPPEGASVSFVACRWREPLQTFATGSGSLHAHCAETREVEGLLLEPNVSRRVGDDRVSVKREWDVLAVIDLGDQQSYVTEGFVVEYREGLRRQRQTTGTRVEVYRPGHEPDG